MTSPTTRKAGRVVYNQLAADFPPPLRDHCLRQLALAYNETETDGDAAEIAGQPRATTVTPVARQGS